MLLIRRFWLVPAFVLALLVYYLLSFPSDLPRAPYAPPPPASDAQRLHWTKRPEKYPLSGLHALPDGPLGHIPRIQYPFETHPEGANDRSTREKRQAAVKDAFVHAWNGYKKHAWTHDEVAPLTGIARTSFGGWGATLVDAMDTLWIMELKEDFDLCVDAVTRIDFSTNDDETINVFETTIRYLGGLLAAYELSNGKYPSLLEKARGLGDMLYSAFDNPWHMPMARWTWRKTALGGEIEPGPNTLLAELGSLTVEFTRLSQLTGDPKFFDAVERISDALARAQNQTAIPGLWPTLVNARDLTFGYNHFTLGGMADSTYEYLPKQYMLLGARDIKYRDMYEHAIDAAKQHLFFRPLVPSNEDILFSGNAAASTFSTSSTLHRVPLSNHEPQGQHLACFVGGMVGIGAKIFSRTEDVQLARRLVDGCVWAYNSMPSGLMPETFHMAACHVGSGEPPAGKCEWSDDKWYEAVSQRIGPTAETKSLGRVEQGKYHVTHRLLYPGFTDHGDHRYILRPEAIESVFIMYRITGDPRLMDVAWKMFQSIETATRTSIAHAAVNDVRKQVPDKSDRMESFWLAETLKYFYLIFSEPTLISLDEWVLNTEAHPFRRPTG